MAKNSVHDSATAFASHLAPVSSSDVVSQTNGCRRSDRIRIEDHAERRVVRILGNGLPTGSADERKKDQAMSRISRRNGTRRHWAWEKLNSLESRRIMDPDLLVTVVCLVCAACFGAIWLFGIDNGWVDASISERRMMNYTVLCLPVTAVFLFRWLAKLILGSFLREIRSCDDGRRRCRGVTCCR